MYKNTDFIKIGSCSPLLEKADPFTNGKKIMDAIDKAEQIGVGLLSFPSLAITSSQCGSLFANKQLMTAQEKALEEIVAHTEDKKVTVILGYYQQYGFKLVKMKGIISNGRILDETYDSNFTVNDKSIFSCITDEPFYNYEAYEDIDNNVIFSLNPNEDAHIEFISSNESTAIGSHKFNRDNAIITSLKNKSAVVFTGEDGSTVITENGKLLADINSFQNDGNIITGVVDVSALNYHKLNNFTDNHIETGNVLDIPEGLAFCQPEQIDRVFRNNPFEPEDSKLLAENCREIFALQVSSLVKRMKSVGTKKLVIGISGGLDSTITLMVASKAMKVLNLPSKNIIAITMPGFGTTDHTYQNALTMMKTLNTDLREIPIRDAVTQHFQDIEQDMKLRDVTYENSQARERTQILMDIANKEGGFSIGTGDLSEIALGWCTFSGDHMAMYEVNNSVPKTMIQKILHWFIDNELKNDSDYSLDNTVLAETLMSVINTPISPELLPPDEAGNMTQKTEDKVGPYILHDFFIYHSFRNGATPSKLQFMAEKAFCGEFDGEYIAKWLDVYLKRFFTQQFKRNCSPDGVKIGSIDLSYKGFVMDSDTPHNTWTK